MTDTTLNQGSFSEKKEGAQGGSHWLRRTTLVTFCLLLVGLIGMVFTRVIAARIPEQRATLEKLITDRTGLAVRFDNVHFAWDLDGMNAVFSRVELTDPKAGRVRVVAPELRVEFDSWDFLRHQQFSFGHVTLSSPDIEIVGDAGDSPAAANAPQRQAARLAPAPMDESALVRRYLSWAELMPIGRIEVEGARVHLLRRGQSHESRGVARQSFTLSQAVVSRGNSTFNAHGTLLLAQDVGQSLFLSVTLQGLGAGSKASGDMRVIARRVFLDKLPLAGLSGRGTVDATFSLRDGRVESGRWQASARELELGGDSQRRFDHVSLNGTLSRDAQELLVDFTDLQITRAARMERAPAVHARIALVPGSMQVARARLTAERVPFMAAELFATIFPAQPESLPAASRDWLPTAGELHDVQYDSAGVFNARVAGLDLTRQSDKTRLEHLSAQLRFDGSALTVSFGPAREAILRTGLTPDPRALTLSGDVALASGDVQPVWRFKAFTVASSSAAVTADGSWSPGATRADPLRLEASGLDQPLLQDAWKLVAAERPAPGLLADIEQLRVENASFELIAAADGDVNWSRSNGALAFTSLVTTGNETPRLSDARGAVKLVRGAASLELDGAGIEGFAVRNARLDWPRRGAPRLHATLDGQMDAPLLREMLVAQGIEHLSGAVSLEADARGERELRDPAKWRVVAHISDAKLPLGGRLPAIEKLAGTMRYSSGQIRGLAFSGTWMGGPVEIESRRAGNGLSFALNGVADAAPLLRLLGQAQAAQRVNGEFAWSGTAQPEAGDGTWKLSLASNLGGVESHLPAPFEKVRARTVPVSAELTVAREGVREFSVEGGRILDIRGQVLAGVTRAQFEIQGVAGELRRSATDASESELTLPQLDLSRTPQVLAAAGALLPGKGELAVNVGEARYGARSLGALHATISQQPGGVGFSVESAVDAPHQLAAQGECVSDGRCRAEFTAATAHLAALLADTRLPAEWPATSLRAKGSLEWPADAQGDIAHSLAGNFDIQTQGASSDHQLSASATLSDGQIVLSDLQGTGPEPDQVFRGNGRVGLLARDYDFTVDYERVSLAATAMPSPARARLARAWNALRGSVARRGWTEAPVTRRVLWHGTWD